MPPARRIMPARAINRLHEAHPNAVRPIRDGPHGVHQRPPSPGELSEDGDPNHPRTKKKLRANINIATLNMNGLSAPTHGMSALEKWAMVNQTLNQHKIAILALQETHLDHEALERIQSCYSKKMIICHSEDPDAPRSTAGVAFVINKTLIAPRNISTYELCAGRALALKIEWLETETTTLLNVYAPNDRSAHSDFWEKVETQRRSRRLPRPDFMLGDLNVTEDPIDRSPPRLDDPSAIDALRETRNAWDIQDAWRLTHPNERAYTYRANANGQQIKSRLDRIYISSQLIQQTFHWEMTPAPVPTDHDLVMVKYAPLDAPEIGKGRWTLPLHMTENEEFLDTIIKRGMTLQTDLDTLQRNTPERSTANPQQLWKTFKTDIQNTAKKMMKDIHYKLNTRIRLLEKDKKALANDPRADTCNNIRTSEAMVTNQLSHLIKKKARAKKDDLRAELTLHGEKLGGVWSALSKERKPRDLIRRLKIPNVEPPQYERSSKKMAELAKEYHDGLQHAGLSQQQEDFERDLRQILNKIPRTQTLSNPETSALSRPLTEGQTEKALHLSKNGSATGMDGCPYELWKALQKKFELASRADKPGFDIIKVITNVLTDIQQHGVDPETDFALGWMCPIYKKKDPTEISNYRPITLLNTDYKILTKILAIQLMDHIETLIHKDQAGFIPNRSIFDHIRMANAIINYAEVVEENGAIVALDQEKAYDKIRHDYLWETLEAFSLPDTFINTVKALYQHASTCVAINGVLSKPFRVQRGIRQGDPLSCPIFDLAIEPLACMIRKDENLKGLTIAGIPEPVKANFFADDTSLYLSETDSFAQTQHLLDSWCHVSGAKFNIEKTEIIPIGKEEYRRRVAETRRLNPHDENRLNERIRIARDGEATRFLGAWIGNHVNDITPWEPILVKIKKRLDFWRKSWPTMAGRKLIVQAIVGGCTQFLAKAQGMPPHIETALTKMIRDFMWEEDSSPRLTLDTLQRPRTEGGLNLLDIQARNEAIELTWLKAYLDFSATRPPWAIVTDIIIDAAAPPNMCHAARMNSFLQNWEPPTRGQRANRMNDDIIRMLKAAKRNNTNLAAIRLSPHLRAQLPAWYHMASAPCPIVNAASKCLLRTHAVRKVADLISASARIRNPTIDPTSPHQNITFCYCPDCSRDRLRGCQSPYACAQEAQYRLDRIAPRLNPMTPGNNHGNLSLTGNRKQRNLVARTRNDAILFDPAITSKDSLAECFRVFTKPDRISDLSANRLTANRSTLRLREISVYTDGACLNNGMENAQCGSGIWIGPNHEQNRSLRVPGKQQSNQVGEVAAVIAALEAVPRNQPLKIVTDSKYTIDGLTTHLSTWEDQGWIAIKNADLFKRAAYLMRRRSAETSFQWVKGHNGDLGNEESDRLAKEGANKPDPDPLPLDIPREFDLQGAKLATLTQALAYKGIKELHPPEDRDVTKRNLDRARDAIFEYNGKRESNEALWRGMQNPAIRIRSRQHLYKAMHSTPKIGEHWEHIPKFEYRSLCRTCQTVETMEHIQTQCQASPREVIWQAAKSLWPHDDIQWPNISLGTILGVGAISLPDPPRPDDERRHAPRNRKGALRLLQILISEAAHLIWVLRCERVIRKKTHQVDEIKKRWLVVINRRLTEDKIIATKIKRDKAHRLKAKNTWEAVLRKEGEIPDQWIHHPEVLVGTRV
jgi:ribonuclease HI/exonuclease III